jgi:hypothetical protein
MNRIPFSSMIQVALPIHNSFPPKSRFSSSEFAIVELDRGLSEIDDAKVGSLAGGRVNVYPVVHMVEDPVYARILEDSELYTYLQYLSG